MSRAALIRKFTSAKASERFAWALGLVLILSMGLPAFYFLGTSKQVLLIVGGGLLFSVLGLLGGLVWFVWQKRQRECKRLLQIAEERMAQVENILRGADKRLRRLETIIPFESQMWTATASQCLFSAERILETLHERFDLCAERAKCEQGLRTLDSFLTAPLRIKKDAVNNILGDSTPDIPFESWEGSLDTLIAFAEREAGNINSLLPREDYIELPSS